MSNPYICPVQLRIGKKKTVEMKERTINHFESILWKKQEVGKWNHDLPPRLGTSLERSTEGNKINLMISTPSVLQSSAVP